MQQLTAEPSKCGTTRAKALAIWVSPHLCEDTLFDPNTPWNRDDCLALFRHLQASMQAHGWACHTQDYYLKNDLTPDAVLFQEIPGRSAAQMIGKWAGKSRVHVCLMESALIHPLNWDLERHREFDAIFTWHPDLLAHAGYHEIRFPLSVPPDFSIKRDLSQKKKLCTLIAGNKSSTNPLELYSERLQAIRWFEKNHPDGFDLYGVGWDAPTFRGAARIRRLGLMPLLAKIWPTEDRPSYRGAVLEKAPILERYRFAICYENARDIPGYVTEKLFDSFLGSCVPVYWGAPDITCYVPQDCFLDFTQFNDYGLLYKHLVGMTDREYLGYLDRIEAFVRSQQEGQFSPVRLANTIAETITAPDRLPGRI